MKILWLVNFRMPIIDKILGKETNFYGGGWLTGLSEKLLENKGNELVICYPNFESSNMETGENEQVSFYGFPVSAKENRMGYLRIEPLCDSFINIIQNEKPDVIHIHGTEFQFSCAMAEAVKKCGYLDKTAVSIQGMVSVYANHFYGNLPLDTKIGKTIKEFIRKEGLKDSRQAFIRRGNAEKQTIRTLHHVIGRTRWDYINCRIINPQIKYHHNNETLRDEFYSGQWQYDKCNKHSIFVSQAGTALKGFPLIVEAVSIVKKFYQDVKVTVAGPKIAEADWIHIGWLGKYVKAQIQENGLEDNILFVGPSNAEEIKNYMLKANAYVSASSIENSPNSLGEAMLLGLPCISSDVGGVTDMLTHNEEGYVFPADSVDMLVYYILRVFEDGEKAEIIGKNASEHARETHDATKNWNELQTIYDELDKGKICTQ